MRWNQVRPSWPDREIHLFGAGVDSGTYDYFTEAITGKEGASRGDFTSSEDDNVLVQGSPATSWRWASCRSRTTPKTRNG